MKKILAIILALVMILSLSATAFAAEIENDNGSSSANVKGTYTAGSNGGTVISVDITWGSMEFNYTAPDEKWDPETHTYKTVEGSVGVWTPATENAGLVKVTNHSNSKVTVGISWNAAENYSGIELTTTTNSIALATADNGTNGAAGTPTTGSVTLLPKGELAETTETVVLGTVTLTVSEG